MVRSYAVSGNYRAIGTHEGLILIDETTGNTKKFDKHILGSNQIFSIKEFNGKFLVGTYHGGIYLLDPLSNSLRRFGPEALSGETVFIIETDSAKNIWIGSSAGLYRFEHGKEEAVALYTSANSQLPEGNVYEIFFDSLNRGWICTENGIAIWNGSQLRATGFPDGFPNKMKIRVVYEDSKHNLYLAPDRGNIWKSDLSITNFSPLKMNLANRFTFISAIIEDNHGHLWFGTDKGLIRIIDDNHFTVINNVDGIANPAYTLCKPYAGSDNTIWFGSTTGLHLTHCDMAESVSSPGRLTISDIKSNGLSIIGKLKSDNNHSPEITLSGDEKDLSINLSDFSFSQPEFFEVEYFCEGKDETWKSTNGTHPIQYFDLKKGKYTLHLRKPGNPESEILLTIKKRSIFNWTILSVVALILLLILATVVLFIQKQRHRQELIEAKGNILESDSYSDAAGQQAERYLPYKTTRLSDEECKRLYKKLESVMKQEKPYTNPGLKSGELAKMVDSTYHALSFLFNQYLNKSYYDYVNQYRVEEFKRLVAETDTSKYTLSALAEKCGFSSRASFFRHFKTITGITPAEYLKSKSK